MGNKLRQLRENANLSGRQLAELLSWPPSKVSKIENGRQSCTRDDVEEWTRAVNAAPEILDELLTALRVIRDEYAAWRQTLSGGTRARQQANLHLEAQTTTLRAFESAIIPGLLQTADYARAVLTGFVRTHNTPDDVEDGVRTRIQRQEVLYDASKHFQFLMTEAALRYRFAPMPVMRAQLDRLTGLAGLDTIEIGVIPDNHLYTVAPGHGFWIFDDRVMLELISAELVVTDSSEMALYARIWDELWTTAAKGADAQALISQMAVHYRENPVLNA